MRDNAATDDVPVFLRLAFSRDERPRALTIIVTPASPVDLDDLVRFKLAARPFIRDLVSDRILVFWELLTPTGVCLVLRDQEIYSDIEELARLEVRFVSEELARLRRNRFRRDAA